MLVFATSDKGGTGRSVTSANLAYHHALDGADVCFLDFDFGSPTAAAVFDLPTTHQDVRESGLHSYLKGETATPHRVDVWARTEHPDLIERPSGSGRLVLLQGDRSGGEFVTGEQQLDRCVDLVLSLKREFDMIVVDLSAGRSYAMDLVLRATAPKGGLDKLRHRWLVFHRWTHQHVRAAAELAFGSRGIVQAGKAWGHRPETLSGAIRFVRAAVPDLESPLWAQATPSQYAWMEQCDRVLQELAADLGIGQSRVLASIPLEPVLQWQERLITETDVHDRRIAANETLRALGSLAVRLNNDRYWGEL